MRLILSLIMTLLILSGCATSVTHNTPSGKPEVTINGANSQDVKAALVTEMLNRGYRIIRDTTFLLEFDQPMDNAFAAVLLGSSYDSTPSARVSFTFSEHSGRLTVVADFAAITNPGSAFERRTDLNSHQDSGNIQQLLNAVRDRHSISIRESQKKSSESYATNLTDRGWLGIRIQPVTDDIAASVGLTDTQGAIIASVDPGGPADKYGLKPGDIVREFDGKNIDIWSQLADATAKTEIGQSVSVKIWRDGKLNHLIVVIGRLSNDAAVSSIPQQTGPSQGSEQLLLGMALRALDPATISRLKINADVEGLLVSSVEVNSDAALKGIQAGDVIAQVRGKDVLTTDEFSNQIRIVREAKLSAILLRVYREGNYFQVALKMSEGG